MSNHKNFCIYCFSISILVFAGILRAQSVTQTQSVIVSPVGGDKVMAGTDRQILWDTHDVTGNVSLSLWDGHHGTWTPICSNVPASQGQTVWHVPANLAGTEYRVKLSSDAGKVQGSEMSEKSFTISSSNASVNASTTGQMVTLMPNPANSEVKCTWPGGAREIALIDVQGNIVHRYSPATTASSLSIATQGLAKGSYYVRITFSNGTTETHPLAVE
jgi:hypothetical protein